MARGSKPKIRETLCQRWGDSQKSGWKMAVTNFLGKRLSLMSPSQIVDNQPIKIERTRQGSNLRPED
jgi:hypothetical protein